MQYNHLTSDIYSTFTPNSISGLAAWYDFSNLASLTLAINKITLINDLSGNGKHLGQITSLNQPTSVSSGGSNNKAYASFSATNSLVSGTLNISQPMTVVFVLKYNGTTGKIINHTDQGGNQGFAFNTGSASVATYMQLNTTDFTDWQIGLSIFDTAATLEKCNTIFYRTGTSTAGITNQLTIGGSGVFQIHEIMYYSKALTSSESRRIREYLHTKYTIAKETTLIALGDSITVGQNATNNNGYIQRFTAAKGWTLCNRAVSGATINHSVSLPGLDDLYLSSFYDPSHYISFAYGTNDVVSFSSTWYQVYKPYIQYFIDKGYPKSKLLVLCFPYQTVQTANLRLYRYQQQVMCAELGLTFYDIFQYTENNGGASLLSDGRHPNDTGHQVMSDYLVATV